MFRFRSSSLESLPVQESFEDLFIQAKVTEKGILSFSHELAISLIKAGVANQAIPGNCFKATQTPLHLSLRWGFEKVSIALITTPNVNLNEKDGKGNTFLHVAAKRHRTALFKLLLERGADPTIVNNMGSSPLQYASMAGGLKEAKLLLRIRSVIRSINHQDNFEKTAFYYALHQRHFKLTNLLAKKGADICFKLQNSHETTHCIHLATACNQRNLIRKMLKNDRFLVNEKNTFSETPLDIAVQNVQEKEEDTRTIELLLRKGADVNCKDSEGYTPLHTAARKGHLKVVGLLLKHGANINAQANNGSTPLFQAVEYSFGMNVIELLLNNGANPLLGAEWPLKGKINKPSQLNKTNWDPELKELLQKYEAIWEKKGSESAKQD